MIELSIRDLLKICGGRLLAGNENRQFRGVCTDSRKLTPGQLFFALRGERFDGHEFITRAFKKGAAGAVVGREVEVPFRDGCLVMVDNPLLCLQRLAAWWRRRFDIPVIGVTGSSGKTTTKDILAGILTSLGKVHKTEGNYNNEIGLPLILLGLDDSHKVCVVEMAMRGLGEIALLCEIARPTGGIITNIGLAHYEKLGSRENIARAKGELAESLPREGFLMLNSEDEWSSFIAEMTSTRVVYYGMGEEAQIRAREVQFTSQGTVFKLEAGETSGVIRSPLLGKHNVYNCLGAIGAAIQLGVSLDQIQEGLDNISLTKMRLEKISGNRGSTIINDTYNANPDSMKASLGVLKYFNSKRSIAVLGDMLELGEIAAEEHRGVGKEVARAGIDFLVTVGNLANYIAEAASEMGMPRDNIFIACSNGEAASFLRRIIGPGDVVLVKGSRAMGMEEIVRALTDSGS